MKGLDRLGIPVQALVINQTILPEVIADNRFLTNRAGLQAGYLKEIDTRFKPLERTRLPLFDHDISDLNALRKVGAFLYNG
jgi:anion-transporting  ArsA/GET3 family ATPase